MLPAVFSFACEVPLDAPSEPSVYARVTRQIDLPAATGTWVLLCHLFVLFSSLSVVWAVEAHREYVASVVYSPLLIELGAGVYVAGIAFEIAQNAIDRWYLTGVSKGLCDMLFYTFMMAGFCLMTMGCHDHPLLWTAAVALVLAFPVAYLADTVAQFPILGWSMILSDLAGYLALDAPVVVLHTVVTLLGLGVLAILMKTHAQWLHGLAAALFGMAIFAWPWAIHSAATGTGLGWGPTALLALGGVLVLAAAFPLLSRAGATPRSAGAAMSGSLRSAPEA